MTVKIFRRFNIFYSINYLVCSLVLLISKLGNRLNVAELGRIEWHGIGDITHCSFIFILNFLE